MSGEYDVALKLYKKLLERYDTRFEKESDSQESPQAMTEEDDEGHKEGGWRWSICGWCLAGVGRCDGVPDFDQILGIDSSNRTRGPTHPGIADRRFRILGLYSSFARDHDWGTGGIPKQ